MSLFKDIQRMSFLKDADVILEKRNN